MVYNRGMFKKIPKNVVVLGLVSFFNDIASEMIYPIVPIFLTSVLGAPVEIVGLIEGIAEGSASFFKFLFGYLSDKLRKRKLFVVNGYMISALSKLLIGLASAWPIVLVARFFDRVGKGLRTSPRDALLLQNATPHNKGFVFGFHRSLDSAGAVLGPILALVLLDLFKESIRTVFFLSFIPGVIGVLLVLFFVRERHTVHDNGGSAVVKKLSWRVRWGSLHPRLKLFFVISVIFALGNSSNAFLILRAKSLGLSTTLAVLVYVLYNIFYTAFSTPAGKWADRIGSRTVYAAGLVVFAFVYFAFALVHSSWWMWVLFPIYGIYIAFTDGVSKAYIADFITEKESGTFFGLYETGISVSAFFASFIGGILWDTYSPVATFSFGGLLAVLAFVLLLYGKVQKRL
jgi:MFS family permease